MLCTSLHNGFFYVWYSISYNDKRVIEKDKNEILSYKYLLTKTIQDDFVNNELSHVNIDNINDPSGKKTYILHCTLKNGVKKELKVEQTLGYSSYNPTGLKNQSDYFMISYGTEGDLIEYSLPNLGSPTGPLLDEMQPFSSHRA